jgi:hypothetical protein
MVVREMIEGIDLVGLQNLTQAEITLANDWCLLTATAA